MLKRIRNDRPYPHSDQAHRSFTKVQDATLTFIDLKKAFDSVETEVVIEALAKQSIQTVHQDPP